MMSLIQILIAIFAIGSMSLLVGTHNLTSAQWSNSTGNATNSTSPGNATNATSTVSTTEDNQVGKVADAWDTYGNP